MSNRYSTSPSHSLIVRSSLRRQLFIFALGLVVGCANVLVFLKGYPVLASVLTVGSIVILWCAMADPMAGAMLKWEAGEWFVRHRGKQTSVLLLPGSARTPWLIYAAFQETHAKQRWVFLLFGDSAGSEELRWLRCRLILET